MSKYTISEITARQILDSRGRPTLQAQVTLECGARGIASVPSGASTGKYEAHELRDGTSAYGGLGVSRAAANVCGEINDELCGREADAQYEIDSAMTALDGTPDKHRLGANAILAVSLACARASSRAQGTPLFRYLGGLTSQLLPIPMMNIIGGGMHADNNIDIQEFLIMPIGAEDFSHAIRMGTEIYHALGRLIHQRKLSAGVGDEGAYAPNLKDDAEALELITDAIAAAGYRAGKDAAIALDVAASGWYTDGKYVMPKKGTVFSTEELIGFLSTLCAKYPIVSIEDPLGEDDFAGFAAITKLLGSRVQIVGDDLFTTNPTRLIRGIKVKSANAILIKPNQIGTLSQTLETLNLAAGSGFSAIVSHRSGETADSTIADIAVASGCGQIKAGAPARGERVEKYNRLLQIESILGRSALYAGSADIAYAWKK